VYYRDDDGRWDEAGSGGAGFLSWGTPWSPSVHRWHGEAAHSLGCSGLDFEDEAGELVLVLVHVGFVRPDVAYIEVDDQRGVRVIETASPVGGFAVLTFGEQASTFRYLDRNRSVLGQSIYQRPDDRA
jgi:hypothetical protein